MSQWNTSDCKGCGEPMIWTVTRNRKKLCLDAETTTRSEAGPKALLFEIHDPDPELDKRNPVAVLTHAEMGHVAHWATCPNREDFKR